LSVNDFKKMNNESYIRITLSNLAALLARANVLVAVTKLSAQRRMIIAHSYDGCWKINKTNELCKAVNVRETRIIILCRNMHIYTWCEDSKNKLRE
jgi:hypothetical protein